MPKTNIINMSNSLLKISNTQVLNQFLHDCVDDLIGCKQISFDSCSSDIEWTNEDYFGALKFVQNIFRENVRNPSKDEFLSRIQDLRPNTRQCIEDCYEIRNEEIKQAVIKDILLKSEHPVVENIDWKLKWVMGSSTLASLRVPLLQLDLHCFKREGENNRKTVNFEMDIEQVDKLIADLEKVKLELHEKL